MNTSDGYKEIKTIVQNKITMLEVECDRYARELIRVGLTRLPHSNQRMFVRLYSSIDKIKRKDLDHVISQIERSMETYEHNRFN